MIDRTALLAEPGPAPGPTPGVPAFHAADLVQAVQRIREPLHVVADLATGRIGAAFGDPRRFIAAPGDAGAAASLVTLVATLPPLYPEWLGDRSFQQAHGLRFPYVAGEMANGIATPALVIAMAGAGMLGFYGSAGLSPDRIERGIDEIEAALGSNGAAWGANLIHNLHFPAAEDAVVDLFLRRGVRRVSASAFMSLTPSVVRYACTGLARGADRRVIRRNHVFAKVSRPELARLFASPAPAALLEQLVARGLLTPEEATLAVHVPVAEDITVEADSGGHTDNRPLVALLPAVLAVVNDATRRHGYDRPVRVGAGGGIGSPAAVAAAFALGAAYVLTGSINQAATESGLSADGRRMLAGAALDDVMMAPAADMFELGVKVQVLKRGTLFGPRAHQLYDLYRKYDGIEALPAEVRARIEREIFRAPLETIWAQTRGFFETRDPAEIERAAREPRHRMALVFRWYLGNASRWSIDGTADRRADYQIWCGPAMGAFNAWTAGTFLAEPERRGAVQIALNLLEGAAVITRAQALRTAGVPVPAAAFDYRARPLG
jgi:trans-AT polyketide synthase, acyltransferase and oxidoreductase domains